MSADDVKKIASYNATTILCAYLNSNPNSSGKGNPPMSNASAYTEGIQEKLLGRIMAKIRFEPDSDCWIWTGGKTIKQVTRRKGRTLLPYGLVKINGKKLLVHRVLFAIIRGPIPSGMESDHLCRRTLCVNPFDIEPVTHSVNMARSSCIDQLRARSQAVTHCPEGHAYNRTNTRTRMGHRQCRSCDREYHREKYRAQQ